MKKPLIRLTALALIFSLTGAPAYAVTETATFNVTATVPTSCSVTAGNNLDFGNYTGTADVDGATHIHVTCTNGGSYTVGLDYGAHPTGTQRKLDSDTTAGNFLNYELYSDAGRTTPWGNDASSWVAGTGTGSEQTLDVYGRIPTGQTPPIAGTYHDVITVTVTF
ncbi:biofilm synthesis protein [Ferrigenium kumadai]|uniref:Biofilm synthesis protein n=1 Tax=Ferrigenium kumadai TaxID=1682490 RepID=A0AAN1SYW6_9PROT|nr:spore coat U domain-containing protein [Ferrigenium kumadai]BBI99211.1 biofilm synthesis protein [Ferrigenium kumadai]